MSEMEVLIVVEVCAGGLRMESSKWLINLADVIRGSGAGRLLICSAAVKSTSKGVACCSIY